MNQLIKIEFTIRAAEGIRPSKILKEYKNNLVKSSLKFKELLDRADEVCENLRETYGAKLVQHRPLRIEKQIEDEDYRSGV